MEDWEKINANLHDTWAKYLGNIFKLKRTNSKNQKKETYILYADWSEKKAGFALFLDDALIWLFSKKCKIWKRAVSLFLDELNTIC